MNKFKFLPFIAAAAVITGCQEYDLGLTADEIRYKESFTNAFGQIDPNQNWDLYGQLAGGGAKSGMTRASVTTSIGDVEIDDLPESQYAILTKEDVTRYQKMLPESEKHGDVAYSETNLGRVVQNFKVKTSSFVLYPVHWNTSGSDEIGFYYHVPSATATSEEIVGIDGVTYNIEKVKIYDNKTHLYYTTDDTQRIDSWNSVTFAIISPYWDQLVTYNSDRYTEEGGVKTINGTVEFSESNLNTLKYNCNDLWNDLCAIASDYFFTGDGTKKFYWGAVIGSTEKAFLDTSVQPSWQANTSQDASEVWGWGTPAKSAQSRGIRVTLPANTEIGMFIKNTVNGSASKTLYSESNLNYTVNWGTEIGVKEACFVATYLDTNADNTPVLDKDGNQVRYLCFEDWWDEKNFDLNDVVFRVYGFDGPGSEVVDNDNYTEEALLVCEDLGDFDFDFNDVVLKLSYQNGITRTTHYNNDGTVDYVEVTNSESIKVTPMAAGGANESTVTIHPAGDTGESNDHVWGEIHTLLGGAAPSIINAGPTFGNAGNTVEYPVTTYGASWDKSVYPTYLSMLFDKGFIKITSSGKDANAITSSGSYTETGTAPQMMLLPMSFEWPQECNPISEVYTGFSSWVSDITATDWINSNNGKVTKR